MRFFEPCGPKRLSTNGFGGIACASSLRRLRHEPHAQRGAHAADGVKARLRIRPQRLVQGFPRQPRSFGDFAHAVCARDVAQRGSLVAPDRLRLDFAHQKAMAPDEIAMVRTIERVIGTQIPRVSEPGYDFGTSSGE